jgi:hypothetical protein
MRAGGDRGLFFVVEPNRTQLSELGQRIAARPVLGAVMPAPREGMAFAAKQCGRSPGKIVRQVANDPA